MHEEASFFVTAFVYLAAAVISVPIAKRLGLGSVLGYLLAGVAIGPFVLHLVGDASGILHFAEFGVVMMLFLIGLELRPATLWKLRIPIMGLGGLQVTICTLAFYFICQLFGLSWQESLAIGLIAALSSTAIVLQSLSERDESNTRYGKSAFAVLLLQDIAVIPILAVLPMLATITIQHGADATSAGGWTKALIVATAVGGIILAGQYLIRPVLRIIADTKLPELFTATALLIVVGITLLMEAIGLSPALGTFLAGVVLAESEYRHELESDIEPFKGLLLGLFFISVGAAINFGIIFDNFVLVIGLAIILIGIKSVVLYVLGRSFRLKHDQSLSFACSLAQGGEFAFVLMSFSVQSGVIESPLASILTAVVAISMLMTPVMFIVLDKYLLPKYRESDSPEQHVESEDNSVIIAGYGRFGQIVGRLFAANGVQSTILDLNASLISTLQKMGHKVYYGDASRVDLLEAAGAHSAKIIVVAVDDKNKCQQIISIVRKHFPHLKIYARAVDRRHAYDLIELKVDGFRRETFDSALELGRDALTSLGFRAYQAHRAAKLFSFYDQKSLHDLANFTRDEKLYFNEAKKHSEDLEEVIQSDLHSPDLEQDTAWDHPELHIIPNDKPVKNVD